nr:hypothetical protein [Clostridia bacterium]
MTSKERVLTAMRRQVPDRVPRFLDYASFAPELMAEFRRRTGAERPEEYFDYDLRIVSFKPTQRREGLERFLPAQMPQDAYVDWDTGNLCVRGAHRNVQQVIHPALSEAEGPADIAIHPMPDWTAPYRWAHLEGEVADLHRRGYAVIGHMSQTLFETAWKMRGFESFLMDMAGAPEMAEALLDR